MHLSNYNYVYIMIVLQDDCFIPVKLPPVYLPSVAHICEAEQRRMVTLFHIEGRYMFIVM